MFDEYKDWNERWLRQIAEWERELTKTMLQADTLMALIKLGISQIKPEPPE